MPIKPPIGALVDTMHPLAEELVGAWLFNENAGGQVYDLSGNGNDGTLTNMDPATDWVPGPDGPVLDFDGSVGAVYSSTISRAGPLTMCALVRIDSSVGFTYPLLLDDHRLNAYGPGNRWRFQIKNAIGTTTITAFGALVYGKWILVVGTCTAGPASAGTMRLYLDGEEKGDINIGEAIEQSGLYHGGLHSTFGVIDGQLAMSVLWGRALSAAEIQALYADPYAMFRRSRFIFDVPTGFKRSVFASPVFGVGGIIGAA